MTYLPLALAYCLLALFQAALGWLFIAPFVGKDGNYIGWRRKYFQPIDSLAVGDFITTPVRYQDREGAFTKSYPEWLRNYVLAVMWGSRNPAYGWRNVRGFTLNTPWCSSEGNRNVDIGLQNTFGTLRKAVIQNGNQYFDWKHCGKWPLVKLGYTLRFGWEINRFDVGYRALLVCNIQPFQKLK